MELDLEGKNAIVTGGSLGIGAAITRALAREGCNVAINYRRHDNEAKEVIRQVEALGRRGLAIKADVQSYDDAQGMVQTVVEELGGLDILVCNAGINWDGVIWKMTEEQWDTVIGVNLKGYFNYNKAAALVFKDQKGGKIVNISSINGMRGKFAQTNYAAVQGWRDRPDQVAGPKELGKFNVNVNAVAPGMVMTDMMENIPPEFLTKAMDDDPGAVRFTRGVRRPGGLSVLGPGPAHHRRGDQDRRWSVHLGGNARTR